MKNIRFLVFFLLLVGFNKTQAQPLTNTDSRVFELRTYYAEPGKLDVLIKRFKKHTTKLFEKHKMQNIGYWLPIDNPKHQLIYVLAYPNMEAREAAWKAFSADPTWQKVQRRSERNGKIVNKVESVFMKATDFSPLIAASKQGNRVFELRIYTLLPDKLDAICTRFREHTMTLFAKHGATNLPYWTTIEKEPTQQPQLIYFLAHASENAGKETFKNFVNDPEWKKVQEESEKNGKIVKKIESIYLNALPFSEIR